MQVWCVEVDPLCADIPSWMVTTEAICIDENRALQFVFEQTGRWLTERDENDCLCETIRGKEWSIVPAEVLGGESGLLHGTGIDQPLGVADPPFSEPPSDADIAAATQAQIASRTVRGSRGQLPPGTRGTIVN